MEIRRRTHEALVMLARRTHWSKPGRPKTLFLSGYFGAERDVRAVAFLSEPVARSGNDFLEVSAAESDGQSHVGQSTTMTMTDETS